MQRDPSLSQLRLQVDKILDRWRAGEKPCALAALTELPELWQHHSLAIDLAYEEYCLREESGEAIDPKQYCQQFSRLRHSLSRMLEVHGLMKSTATGPASEKTIDWPTAGQPWLDWVLLEEIGRGAFSRVFIALEPSLGNRRVVIKCSTSGPGEAFLLGQCAHPNVMPIHSVRHDEVRGLVSICMPFVGQVTLAQVLDRIANTGPGAVTRDVFSPKYGVWPDSILQVGSAKQPNSEYALEAARQVERVARGLEAAHALKILHGDIKPSNIILSFAGEPLLVDFNLSVAEQAPLQRLGGTPPYMAPERLRLLSLQALAPKSSEHEPAEKESGPDLRSDVFSLGVVLYELLFGETPFEFKVEGLTATYERKSSGRLTERLDVSGQLVPADLVVMIERAIAVDPEQRFSSATALANSLADFIRKHTPNTTRRPRMWFVALIMLVLAPACAIPLAALGLYGNRPSERQASPTTPPRSKAYQTLQLAIQDLEEKDYLFAAERLQNVHKEHPRPEFAAWIGYCFAQRQDITAADFYFHKAEPVNDHSGIVWHNIACCSLLNKLTPETIEYFDRALDQNRYLGASYQQRAVAKTRIAMRGKIPPLPGTFDDIEAAISLGASDPYFMFEAARSLAYGAGYEPPLGTHCERYIRLAMERGVPPELFKGSTFKRFNIGDLRPSNLPAPASKPDDLGIFLRPPFDLKRILSELP
jgi:serine/threonine protein kinase